MVLCPLKIRRNLSPKDFSSTIGSRFTMSFVKDPVPKRGRATAAQLWSFPSRGAVERMP